MIKTFETVVPHLRITRKLYSIDNLWFKFHYRFTFIFLLVCTILVTSRQYIGEHIRCMIGSNVIPEHVINTFCFFTSTFTVVRHFNETNLQNGVIPHPGVGPMKPDEEVTHHAYYQWVPFFLFGQAIMFYLPHLLWKKFEGGSLKVLSDGLKKVILSKYITSETDYSLDTMTIQCQSNITSRIDVVALVFMQRLAINKYWSMKLMGCELLNMANLMLQVYVTNRFLNGKFYGLGPAFINEDFQGQMDVLDIVFPKMTKCHFFKYGPSGTIQKHDALCVMALNVINEKIFVFLWFWFAILFFVTTIALFWRMVTYFFYRSDKFSGYIFAAASPGRFNGNDLSVVLQHLNFSNWLFLYYLAKNMERQLFRMLLWKISRKIARDERGYDSDGDDNDEPEDSSINDEKRPLKRDEEHNVEFIDTVDYEKK